MQVRDDSTRVPYSKRHASLVISAIAKSTSTLLGPLPALKLRPPDATDSPSAPQEVACDAVSALAMLDVRHPQAVVLEQAVRGLELGHGSGMTTLVALIAALAAEAVALLSRGAERDQLVSALTLAMQHARGAAEELARPLRALVGGAARRHAESALVDGGADERAVGTAFCEEEEEEECDEIDWFFDDSSVAAAVAAAAPAPAPAPAAAARAAAPSSSSPSSAAARWPGLHEAAAGLHHGKSEEMELALVVLHALGDELDLKGQVAVVRMQGRRRGFVVRGVVHRIEGLAKVQRMAETVKRCGTGGGGGGTLAGGAGAGAGAHGYGVASAGGCGRSAAERARGLPEPVAALSGARLCLVEGEMLDDDWQGCVAERLRALGAAGVAVLVVSGDVGEGLVTACAGSAAATANANAAGAAACGGACVVVVPAVGLRALRRLAAATGARLLGDAAEVRGDKHCGKMTLRLQLWDESWLNVDEGYTTGGASVASAMSVLLLVEGSRQTILRPESCLSPVLTVVLGASTVGALALSERRFWSCAWRLRQAVRDSCVLPGAGAHEIFTAHRLEEEACRIERELAASDDPDAEYGAVDPDAPKGVKGANVYGLRALAAALLAVVEATARNSSCGLERCMIDPSAYSAEGLLSGACDGPLRPLFAPELVAVDADAGAGNAGNAGDAGGAGAVIYDNYRAKVAVIERAVAQVALLLQADTLLTINPWLDGMLEEVL